MSVMDTNRWPESNATAPESVRAKEQRRGEERAQKVKPSATCCRPTCSSLQPSGNRSRQRFSTRPTAVGSGQERGGAAVSVRACERGGGREIGRVAWGEGESSGLP